MNFPPYWAKGSYAGKTRAGKEMTIDAFGWSYESTEDARLRGRKRAQWVVENGIGTNRKAEYEYGETPFREELVDSLAVNGKELALISRNRYGSLVLNSPCVMFVDIDIPEHVSTGIWDSILLVFFRKRREERKKIIEDVTIGEVEEWSRNNPTKSFRLYKTHSGLRVLLSDSTYDPKSDESKMILAELKADPLYRALTERQKCYRARLTPKPWRCKSMRPPSRYPWTDQNEEKKYRDWEAQYMQMSEQYSTCILHREYGSQSTDPNIQKVIDLHDCFTIKKSKPLA